MGRNGDPQSPSPFLLESRTQKRVAQSGLCACLLMLSAWLGHTWAATPERGCSLGPVVAWPPWEFNKHRGSTPLTT